MLLGFISLNLLAQQEVSLENLDNFKDQAGNWQIVGAVTVNRNIDVHQKQEVELDSKKKKKKKKKNEVAPLKAVEYTNGTGILLNLNDENKKDALLTNWEHGDVKIELDVMLPKGSNSGIYLQGRYELQLLDSWGIKNPKYSDIGGIYRNWESDPNKALRGVPPLTNASKAPGLWQHIKIHFQAPRFDADGNKVANAKFVAVELNGIRIHNNVEVPTYTGGQISKEEVAKGPLMIQGDHGPVAIRNFTYQLLKESTVQISDLSYKVYEGDFEGLEELETLEEVASGTAKKIDVNIVGEDDKFGIIYTGNMNIEEDDTYAISVGYSGGVRLIIDGESILENNSPSSEGVLEGTLKLTKGSHKIELINIKSAAWRGAKLGMYIQSASTNKRAFHAFDSFQPSTNSVSPIFVEVESDPRLLRGFVSFKGDGEKLSHTIGVGTPQGVNFIYELNSANLVGVWRGDFVDATPMWHNRGDGSFNPRGAVQWTFLNQPIAKLEKENEAFPNSGDKPNFVSKGYAINQENGMPIFKHVYHGVEIENKISLDKTETYFIQEVSFSETGLTNWYYKLAQGEIKIMADGSYAVGGQQYYVNILSGQTPIIREVEGVTELVLPVDGSRIKYEIIW